MDGGGAAAHRGRGNDLAALARRADVLAAYDKMGAHSGCCPCGRRSRLADQGPRGQGAEGRRGAPGMPPLRPFQRRRPRPRRPPWACRMRRTARACRPRGAAGPGRRGPTPFTRSARRRRDRAALSLAPKTPRCRPCAERWLASLFRPVPQRHDGRGAAACAERWPASLPRRGAPARRHGEVGTTLRGHRDCCAAAGADPPTGRGGGATYTLTGLSPGGI